MNDTQMMTIPDQLLIPAVGDFSPGDSIDPTLDPFFEPFVEPIPPEFSDEALFLDSPDDDEERDDEMMLALLEDLGVELDSLDEPVELADTEFLVGFGLLEETDEDDVAA